MNKEVVLFTSGVDSYILREYLIKHGHSVDCLYFNHGGRYSKNELKTIKKLPFEVIINDSFNMASIEQPNAHIPNRNILFSVMANSIGYDKIWIGGSKSDRSNDNNEGVFKRLSEFLTNINGRYIKIDSSFWDIYKDQMINWYSSINNSEYLVCNTFSCFTPIQEYESVYSLNGVEKNKYQTEECLNCAACFRKCSVLFNAGIYINFTNKDIVKKYYTEFNNTISPNKRSDSTLNYINQWFKSGNRFNG